MVDTLNRVSYAGSFLEDDFPEEDEEFNKKYTLPSRQFSAGVTECKIIRDDFGFYKACETDEGKVIHRFTFLNKEVTVQILTYGATVTSVTMPDKNGVIDDVVLGFDSYEEYRNTQNPYFGATIGRVTGVIPQCEFSVDQEKYFPTNNFMGIHHANGGFVGFDKVMWNAFVENDKLYLTYMSENDEEGFPGDVLVTRSYELTSRNELIIETTARCTKPTPLDVSTHIDWNLAGHFGGPSELYKHYLMVNADKYAQLDKDYAITGKLKKVSRTVLDFRIIKPLGRLIHKVPGGGYNHFMSLTRGSRKCISFAAKLVHPESGRYVEVLCDQPGLLIYTQNNLYAQRNAVLGHPISCWVYDPTFLLKQQCDEEIEAEPDMKELEEELEDEDVEDEYGMEGGDTLANIEYAPLLGKQGTQYVRHSGIRLVPLNYPEPVAKRRKYSQYIINPGDTYLNTTIFKFGTKFEKHINLADVIVPDVAVDPENIPEESDMLNPL